jgi:mRNA-degrading endonuclease toxin of MazEF toxin-antitoxin module
LDRGKLTQRVGTLSTDLMWEIEQGLRAALDLE